MPQDFRKDRLKASEDKFARAFNHAPMLMTISAIEDGRYLDVNDRFCEVSGFSRQEAIGRTSLELGWISPSERERMIEVFKRNGRVCDMELALTAKNGAAVHCLYSAEQITIEGKERLLSIAMDITGRKHAEKALQESELKFRTLFATLQDALFLTAAEDGRIIECNDKLSGYSREELLGNSTVELGLWANMDERQQVVDQIAAQGYVYDFEALFRRKDGTVFPGSISTNAVNLNGKTFLLSVVRDISERNRFLNALQESEQHYRTLFDTMQEGFALHEIICDDAGRPVDYRFIQVNGAFERLTGLWGADLIGRTVLEVMPATEPIWIETYGRVALSGEPAFLEHYARELDRHYEVHAYQPSPGRFAVVFSDVTERKILQQEREKAQRLSSLGVLAGGIAHDFNNILTGIIGNISIASMQLGQEHKAAERLKECQNAARRAAELTQQLLTFSRGGEPVKTEVDAARLITEALSFSLRGSNVKGDFICAPNLRKIDADAGQINQVLNNLLINARQAMETGGTVRVRANNCEIHKGDSLLLAPGRYVRIVVEDKGCGIPQADIVRIFDPYFTTKERGTGLGLTSVYSIVRRHGGQVEVASAVGRGTSFTIFLPAVADAVGEMTAPHHGEGLLQGSGRVLVMDDEKMIRDLAVEMLEEAGYEVESCDDGAQAVARFTRARQEGATFDVVILDLTVPGGMGGKEAAALIREQDRDVALIVSSGYSNDPIMADFRSYGFSGAVAKPYTIESITGELALLLRARRCNERKRHK